ncbi:hypothetical protein PAXRUDRAFT_277486 [Paxillus rubicundulus Ve08.2h10]|uniref:Unplaced genomic scaffold scaffold_1442, whole genome shotgun sequence n=1 Tax=Paxillus rubicundulus Ve08.2h10 TaxID=930991 RepID=A0A0D0D765_9AGAM|nr:hypothetical protein PAXRUDRAFT_277486 [Paxillus rubicundulus Ve08.2h10]
MNFQCVVTLVLLFRTFVGDCTFGTKKYSNVALLSMHDACKKVEREAFHMYGGMRLRGWYRAGIMNFQVSLSFSQARY